MRGEPETGTEPDLEALSAPGLACAVRSLALGEPLAGTASRYRHWLMVEQPGRWGHEALTDSDFPVEVGRRLHDAGLRLTIRVLLIKRRDRPAPARRRCFAAYTGVRRRHLATFEVDDPRELLWLDLPRLVRERWAGLGEHLDGPLFLACTHGKHDPCCAREGTPLAAGLLGFERGEVWECSHVGGDRFAGNLVAFPHGAYFGRVGALEAARVATAYAEGRVDLRHYRGRSCHSPAVQFAEHVVRERLGLDGIDDLSVSLHERLPEGRHRVGFRAPDGREHLVELRAVPAPPRPLTCKAAEPQSPRVFVLADG
jgi:Sucrase/ferredoxin-like